MVSADVPAVLAVQQPGAVIGLAKVFPQDEFPFPREAVARRWLEEIETHEIDCFVVERSGAVIGFAAIRADEFMHFGLALELWGTGAAQDAHDAVLDRMTASGITRAWLRVFTDNERGRRFYDVESHPIVTPILTGGAAALRRVGCGVGWGSSWMPRMGSALRVNSRFDEVNIFGFSSST